MAGARCPRRADRDDGCGDRRVKAANPVAPRRAISIRTHFNRCSRASATYRPLRRPAQVDCNTSTTSSQITRLSTDGPFQLPPGLNSSARSSLVTLSTALRCCTMLSGSLTRCIDTQAVVQRTPNQPPNRERRSSSQNPQSRSGVHPARRGCRSSDSRRPSRSSAA